ncbi:hypothetical protein [Streptomonospora alba]|uniref:hypothetical protein n=1 Tax=Streptomonospora alba TaxID=183763 RepID=UPI0012ECBD8B|nr:hypothetical protein [Streptomonospora alba]
MFPILRGGGWVATAAASCLLATTGFLAAAISPASAQDSPNLICNNSDGLSGGDFWIVADEPIPNDKGRLYVLFDDHTGNVCAVVVGNVSEPTSMEVGLKHSSAGPAEAVWSYGTSEDYAGPVYLTSSRGICVVATGAVLADTARIDQANCDT